MKGPRRETLAESLCATFLSHHPGTRAPEAEPAQLLLRVAHHLWRNRGGTTVELLPRFERAEPTDLPLPLPSPGDAEDDPRLLVETYDAWLRVANAGSQQRKASGAFHTPSGLAERLIEPLVRERAASLPWICDPAMGAGAFLLAAARAARPHLPEDAWRTWVLERVCGIDLDPLAVAVASWALQLLVAAPLPSGDQRRIRGCALAGRGFHSEQRLHASDEAGVDYPTAFAAAAGQGGFDLVIGNPPWVAFQGRAAQPLAAPLRKAMRERFRSWHGYPSLHGVFVERAAELAPQGTLALLVPSPVADLPGYRFVREALTQTHRVREPLEELGQDAFPSVVQSCFFLVADPHPQAQGGTSTMWKLRERTMGGTPFLPPPPAILSQVSAAHPPFPKELFGELGFQTNRTVSERYLQRGTPPTAGGIPLLEGKRVLPFVELSPCLWLTAGPEELAACRARLRPIEDFRRAAVVIRQTAIVPIAAKHLGVPFRNSLLAAFAHDEFDADLLVGLLNSSLYAALHLAAHRDARQAAFPQVKIGQLRQLPAPPLAPSLRAAVRGLSKRASATDSGERDELWRQLDTAVFALFELTAEDEEAVRSYVARLAPSHGACPRVPRARSPLRPS